MYLKSLTLRGFKSFASATLDLPEPFGPTTQVMPGSSRNEVADANDLKPLRVRLLRYTSVGLLWGRR